MSLSISYSRADLGLSAPLVSVEVHLTGGLPHLSIVGLPEAAVRESKDRVRSALINARFEYPRRRITVNLAPADLPKTGGRFDLAIALGILAASGQLVPGCLQANEFIGELALGGGLRPARAVLPAAIACRNEGRHLLCAPEDAAEAVLANGAEVYAARDLLEVCAHLSGERPLPRVRADDPPPAPDGPDLADVLGQYQARRALEIAAAGAHNLLFIGPPGSGKTMLATRMAGILPPMSEREALDTAAVQAIGTNRFDPATFGCRPMRTPHHTASAVALVGGGPQPRPGEASLAHNGVLFLDELPEFQRSVLEVLREPLESGWIHVSRAAHQAVFPARFQLLAAMNPCPCGHLGDATGRCRCSPDAVRRYRARVSGPVLDRIDMHVEVPALAPDTWRRRRQASAPEPSAAVRARVVAARARQLSRAARPNAHLLARDLRAHCVLDAGDEETLAQAIARLALSARARDRIVRVARTIADLEASPRIRREHLVEAITYRALERPVS